MGGGAKSPTNAQPGNTEATSLTSGPRMTCADSASFEESGKSLPGASGADAPNSGEHEDVFEHTLSEDVDSDWLAQAALVYTDMDEEQVAEADRELGVQTQEHQSVSQRGVLR